MDPKPAPDRTLKDMIRSLRIDEAERTGVVVALREADLARLGMLQDRLKPVFDEVPRHVELFDTGITPGETPRLWIDMVSFVEIGRDKRSYRFLQDTRDGRRVLIESADLAAVTARITAYVARRLIERERLLAQTAPADAPAAEPVLPPADLPPSFLAATAAKPDTGGGRGRHRVPAGTRARSAACALLRPRRLRHLPHRHRRWHRWRVARRPTRREDLTGGRRTAAERLPCGPPLPAMACGG